VLETEHSILMLYGDTIKAYHFQNSADINVNITKKNGSNDEIIAIVSGKKVRDIKYYESKNEARIWLMDF
jgi:hypothetical protein